LNLLIAEVAYAISNLPKTIIQMQQPIIDLYLAESSSVQKPIIDLYLAESYLVPRIESYISGW
jgi:hypothetical protein